MEIIVKAVVGQTWNDEGGCTLILDSNVGGTVRETIELTFASAAQVASLLEILAGGPGSDRAR